jgi:hypothetical protein
MANQDKQETTLQEWIETQERLQQERDEQAVQEFLRLKQKQTAS